ncbi:MAG: hypothetical protein E7447_06090 [Ruminococcaceae bacterium]|nr:hypothetical protein [Oscillospiraceae bacterium]
MKKISIFLILMLAVVMLAVPVLAAQPAAMTVNASDKTLDRGDTVVITVSTTKVDECVSGGFMLTFDKNVFEFVSGESALSAQGYMAGVSNAAGNVAGYFMNGNKTVEGEIFKITLRVKDTAAYGSYTVSGVPNLKAGGAAVECTVNEVTFTVACRHTFGAFEFVNDSTHKHTCTKCGHEEQGSHVWDNGTITQKPDCEKPGELEKTCSDCKAKTTEPLQATGHAWDNACDTDCNNGCGLTRTTEHTYETAFSSDATGHWYACSICGDKKDFAVHTPGPEATTTSAQLCLDCSFEIAPKLTHLHQMSTEWITDDTYHWHRCQWSNPSCHYTEDKAEHDYDNDCDVDCNTCGYVRLDAPHNYSQEWMGNAEGHWFVCLDCFGQSEVEKHVPGPAATETEPQRCTECNIVIAMPLNHVHEFGSLWYFDENSHWQCCSDMLCFETTDPEPHTWDEGLDMASGGKQYSCTTCGKQMETQGTTPTQPSVPPTTQPTTAPAQQDEPVQEQNGFSWEWIAIAAIILLAIGFILLIIEFIRSHSRNSHGRFSK